MNTWQSIFNCARGPDATFRDGTFPRSQGSGLVATELGCPCSHGGYPCDGANGSLWDVENDTWIACTKDGEILATVTPYHGRFDWPIEVGKTWRTRYFWNDRVTNRGWSGWSWQDWAVVAWHRSPNDGYGGAEHEWELISYDVK